MKKITSPKFFAPILSKKALNSNDRQVYAIRNSAHIEKTEDSKMRDFSKVIDGWRMDVGV